MLTLVHCPLAASKVSKVCFASLLKVGFIISDEAASIGYVNYFVELLVYLDNASNESKLKIMLKNLDPELNTELIEYVHEFQRVGKAFKKQGHKQTNEVKWYKGYENAVMVHYKEWARHRKYELEIEGFVTLMPLLMEKGNIGIYYLKEDNYMLHKGADKYQMNLEEMLNLLLPDSDQKNTLLAFHEIFMNSTIMKKVLFVSATDPLAENTNNSYFYYAASVTDINVLTLEELKAIKAKFDNKLIPFRKLIDEWTVRCNVWENKTAGIEYFKDQILSALPLLDNCFKEEPILQYNFKHEVFTRYYLYIGEITKTALLNYYTTMDIITKEDRIILEEKMKTAGNCDRRIPMIIISKDAKMILPGISGVETAEVPEEVITKRKFIELD